MKPPNNQTLWEWLPGKVVLVGFLSSMIGLVLAFIGLTLGTNVADTELHPSFALGVWIIGAGIAAIFLGFAILFGRTIRAGVGRRQAHAPLTSRGTAR